MKTPNQALELTGMSVTVAIHASGGPLIWLD